LYLSRLFKKPVFTGASKEEVIQNNREGKMNLDMEKLEE